MIPGISEEKQLELVLIAIKQVKFNQLEKKLSLLTNHSIEISYDLNLTQKEQIYYAKVGLFEYWCDLNGRSKTYS